MKRNGSLDVLRGLAVLSVIGFHLQKIGYSLWSRAGWIGVDLFFVLSGFLISGLLFTDYQQHGSINWKRFAVRRGFKIWPPFYAFIGGTYLLLLATHEEALEGRYWPSALFLQNYFHIGPGIYSHIWSLCVEEHFYLLLPAVLLCLARRRTADPFRSVPYIFAALAVACLVLRRYTLPFPDVAFATHLRLDSLFAGVTLGYLYHFRPRAFRLLTGYRALLIGLVLCSPALVFESRDPRMQSFGLTGLLVGFSLIVAWAVVRSPGPWSKPFAAVGRYSYSIYLWHTIPVAMFLDANSRWGFWGGLVASLMLGYAASLMVEQPFLRLRDKFTKRENDNAQKIRFARITGNRVLVGHGRVRQARADQSPLPVVPDIR